MFSHRFVSGKFVLRACASGVLLGSAAFAAAQAADPEAAVVYFSLAENVAGVDLADALSSASLATKNGPGTTAFIAKAVESTLERMYGTDIPLVGIVVKDKYPAGFDRVIARNHEEAAAGRELPLAAMPGMEDAARAKTIFIGYPTWNMTTPVALAAFMKSVDWQGKRIAVFNTNDGYGPGRGAQAILSLAPGAEQLGSVFSVKSDAASGASAEVQKWVSSLGMSKDSASAASQVEEVLGAVAGKIFRIKLNDSPEARQFARMLPMRVRMSGFGGREYYGGIEGEIKTTGPGQYNFKDGTLTYCPTNNTVAVFYAQTDRPNLTMAVYPMGQVEGDLELFHQLGHSEVFEFQGSQSNK